MLAGSYLRRTAYRRWSHAGSANDRDAVIRARSDPLVALLLVALIAVIVHTAVALVIRRAINLTGDEPHYLVVTQSLVYDQDLDVANQYALGQSQLFRRDDLSPLGHARDYHGDGRLFHLRPPGQSVLLLPAYAAGELAADRFGRQVMTGYVAMLAFLVGLSSLLWVMLYQAARRAGATPVASLIALLAIGGVLPVLPYGTQIYPEFSAALAIVIALHAMTWATYSGRSGIAAAAIMALPFLHQRFLPVAAFLLLVAAIVWRRSPARLVGLAAVTLVGALGLGLYSQHAYGSLLPTAGWSATTISSVANFQVGFGLLFLDDGRGLLSYAPQYVLVAGLWAIVVWRACGPQRIWMVGAAGALAAMIVTSASTFGGGDDIPPRHLVAGLILAVVPLAIALSASWRRAVGVSLGVMLLPGLILTLYCTANTVRMFDVELGNRAWSDMAGDLEAATGVLIRPNDWLPAYRNTVGFIDPAACREVSGGAIECRSAGTEPLGRYVIHAVLTDREDRNAVAARLEVVQRPRGRPEILIASQGNVGDGVGIVLSPIPNGSIAPDDPALIEAARAETGLPPEVIVAAYRAGATYFRENARRIPLGHLEAKLRASAGPAGVEELITPDTGPRLIDVYARMLDAPVRTLITADVTLTSYAEVVYRVVPLSEHGVRVRHVSLARQPRWIVW